MFPVRHEEVKAIFKHLVAVAAVVAVISGFSLAAESTLVQPVKGAGRRTRKLQLLNAWLQCLGLTFGQRYGRLDWSPDA